MKIAVVSPWETKCGIFTYTRDLTAALAEIDVESIIVRLPRFGVKTPELLRVIVESIPIDKVDAIHVMHEYGLYKQMEGGFYGFLKALGKPIVTTMHAVSNFEIDSLISSISDRIIVHNEFCFKNFAFPDKTVIIPHGLNQVECPPPDEAKKSIGIPPEAPIVGYLGFISTYKGIEILIEAMQEITEAGLLIAGGWHTGSDTSYIAELKRRTIETLEGRCQWLGYVPDKSLPSTYGAMDIVVYPSRFATESGALLTALGHGKATITSKLPPFKEKEELGALMTFNDLEDLREKMKLLLTDDDARGKLEAGAMAYAEANSWSKVAEKHLTLYEEILIQSE